MFEHVKELLEFANLLFVFLVLPIVRYIKESTKTNIELKNTILMLQEEIELLRGILFEIADGDVIKRHINKRAQRKEQ